METLVDDVGSFPLPVNVERKVFNKAYELTTKKLIEGKNIKEDTFLAHNFYQVVIDSFRKKLATGLDIVNYPQHYDMHKQFANLIRSAMNEGTYVIAEKNAIIPEILVIKEEAKILYEETGKQILLRACVTGPFELYLREIGTVPYKEVLLMFAETVQRFAKNSILNSKYVKTEIVSLDEPSFGFQETSANHELILEVFEKAFNFKNVTKQIHLHSPSRIADILNVENVDVLSFEYAASQKNIESVSRKMLEEADKTLRVGVSRTDIDSIIAELHEKGVTKPTAEQLAENEETIQKRFAKVKEKYGDSLSFTGPDCGLGGWPTQEAAQLLLKRTVNAVKSTSR